MNDVRIFQSLWFHLLPTCKKDRTELQILQRLSDWYHNEGKIDELREATQFHDALKTTVRICIHLKRVDLLEFLSSNIPLDSVGLGKDYLLFDALQVIFEQAYDLKLDSAVNVIIWVLDHIQLSSSNQYSLTILIVAHKYFILSHKCRWLQLLNKAHKKPKSHLHFINQLSCKYINLDLFHWSNDQLYEQYGEVVNAKEALNTIQLQVDSIQRQHLDDYTFMVEYLKTLHSHFMQVVTTETDLYTDLISVVQKYL
jgi:hypothetical protein